MEVVWNFLTRQGVCVYSTKEDYASWVKYHMHRFIHLVCGHTITHRKENIDRFNTIDLDVARVIFHGVKLHLVALMADMFSKDRPPIKKYLVGGVFMGRLLDRLDLFHEIGGRNDPSHIQPVSINFRNLNKLHVKVPFTTVDSQVVEEAKIGRRASRRQERGQSSRTDVGDRLDRIEADVSYTTRNDILTIIS
ncbi:hypothetical protein LINPERPRIM_LOCUS807 [Linum perenne]